MDPGERPRPDCTVEDPGRLNSSGPWSSAWFRSLPRYLGIQSYLLRYGEDGDTILCRFGGSSRTFCLVYVILCESLSHSDLPQGGPLQDLIDPAEVGRSLAALRLPSSGPRRAQRLLLWGSPECHSGTMRECM